MKSFYIDRLSVRAAKIASISIAAMAISSLSASAQVLNLNFGRVNDGPLFGGSGSYTGQGAYTDTGNNKWNNLLWSGGATPPSGSTLTSLSYSDNTAASGVSISFTGSGITSENYNSGIGTSENQMLYGFALSNTTNANQTSVNILGLLANTNYTLYVYAQKSNSTGTTFKVNSDSYSLAGGTGAQSAGFVQDVNYHIFANEATDNTGKLSINWYANLTGTGSFTQGPFNGLQLVKGAASVPEPGAIALVGGIAVIGGSLAVRRKRRK